MSTEQLPKAVERELDHLEGLACYTMELLEELGVDHGEASVGRGESLEVGVRDGEVELLKEARSSGLSLRVVYNERVAVSSTNNLDREALRRFVAQTLEMAEISEPDPVAAPPDPSELLTRLPRRNLESFDPRTARITVARGQKLALAAERAATRSKRITASEGASFSKSVAQAVMATSGGFVGRSAGSYQALSAQVIADDADQKKRNGSYGSGARFFEDIDTPAQVGREAARRALASIGSRPMTTGTMPVVFDRDAASELLSLFVSCLYGDSIFRDQSYLAKRLHSQVAASKVTIVDDPFIPRGIASRLFDGEGRKTSKLTLVNKGVLQQFLLDTYSARKLKLPATGSAGGAGGIPHPTCSNLYLKAGRKPPAALLEGIEKGLYVTNMMGFGFDPVTGKLSRGAAGFAIENGELTWPVSEVTVSRNLDSLFQDIDMIADDLELHGSISSPSLRVREMTVSGQG